MDSFMRSFFPEDHFDDPPYEPPSEVVQDIIDEEERAKKAAALAANPEKKVSFHTTFLRCKAYIERFGGRLKFVKGPAPNSLDIVLYVGPAIFRNNEDHDFLLDLGRAAERLFIRAYRGKVQIRIGLPPDNLKY